MQGQNITIKGIRDGLLITLHSGEEWGTTTAELAARLDEKRDFFAGARITVDVGERPVPKHELTSLKALLERRDLTLMVVLSDSQTTIEAAEALDLRTSVGGALPGREPNETLPIDPEEKGTDGVMIRRTLRSGRTLHSDGHVVVFGDVNAGAKIVAEGDIIIWGRLRGNVHAGAYGDENAVVCALDMTPTQLRIAGYMVTSPDEKRPDPIPEVASIRNQQIIVEAWRD
jgi:septum site-determining protein MinC